MYNALNYPKELPSFNNIKEEVQQTKEDIPPTIYNGMHLAFKDSITIRELYECIQKWMEKHSESEYDLPVYVHNLPLFGKIRCHKKQIKIY